MVYTATKYFQSCITEENKKKKKKKFHSCKLSWTIPHTNIQVGLDDDKKNSNTVIIDIKMPQVPV